MKILDGVGNAYAGKAKLWRVFWLGYILLLIPVTIATNIAKEIWAQSPASFVPEAISLVVLFYYIWLSISLWRCAPNSTKRIYKILGRVWAVVIGMITLSGLLIVLKSMH